MKNQTSAGPVVRDRQATRMKLIQAVGTILSEKGFTALGVNAVARKAGVDKVLIYRYFGGMEQLMEAFGRESDFWPSIQELAGGDQAAYARLPLSEKLSQLTLNYTRALQSRPLTLEIMAWEMVERNRLTAELEAMRESTIMHFYEKFFDQHKVNVDLQALTAVIGAGLSYLVTRGRNIDIFNGIDLKSDQGWQRIQAAINIIILAFLKDRSTDKPSKGDRHANK
ncbi:MAG: TetR/AcrR family transcriptional regulator [Thermodesulfobacteriota bacterium]